MTIFGIVIFLIGWIYAIAQYGVFVGVGLGWIPAFFFAWILDAIIVLVFGASAVMFQRKKVNSKSKGGGGPAIGAKGGGGPPIGAGISRSVESTFKHNPHGLTAGIATNKSPVEKYDRGSAEDNVHKFINAYFLLLESTREVRTEKLSIKPSWMHNQQKVHEFVGYLTEQSKCRGVSDSDTMAIYRDSEFANLVYSCVATAENQGCSFDFQKQLGIEIIERGWRNWDA